MEFRFAEEADLGALTALINEAFQVERFFKTSERLSLESTREYFAKGRYLLAEEKAALAGCVYVELQGNRCYLGMLSVDPSRQKSGLGRRLVAGAEEFAREMGAHQMVLTVVNLRSELPPYYEKLGYSIAGMEPIPEDMVRHVNQTCHFIRMTKKLGSKQEK